MSVVLQSQCHHHLSGVYTILIILAFGGYVNLISKDCCGVLSVILPPLNDARFQAGPVLIGVWAGVKMSQASSRSGFGNWFNQVAAGVRELYHELIFEIVT